MKFWDMTQNYELKASPTTALSDDQVLIV